jgi:hypothetical protein
VVRASKLPSSAAARTQPMPQPFQNQKPSLASPLLAVAVILVPLLVSVSVPAPIAVPVVPRPQWWDEVWIKS